MADLSADEPGLFLLHPHSFGGPVSSGAYPIDVVALSASSHVSHERWPPHPFDFQWCAVANGPGIMLDEAGRVSLAAPTVFTRIGNCRMELGSHSKGCGWLKVALAVVAIAACDSDDMTGPVPGVPTSVAIVPDSANLTYLGETLQFTAVVRDGTGASVGGSVRWETSDGAVVGVDAQGLVTARGNGTADVRASLGDLGAAATVRVEQGGRRASGFRGWPVGASSAVRCRRGWAFRCRMPAAGWWRERWCGFRCGRAAARPIRIRFGATAREWRRPCGRWVPPRVNSGWWRRWRAARRRS